MKNNKLMLIRNAIFKYNLYNSAYFPIRMIAHRGDVGIPQAKRLMAGVLLAKFLVEAPSPEAGLLQQTPMGLVTPDRSCHLCSSVHPPLQGAGRPQLYVKMWNAQPSIGNRVGGRRKFRAFSQDPGQFHSFGLLNGSPAGSAGILRFTAKEGQYVLVG